MKKYIIIKADTNDADYVTKERLINDEQLEEIKPAIEAVKNSKQRHNWGTGDGCNSYESPEAQYVDTGIITEDQMDALSFYLPTGEYGIHTIVSIKILVIQEEYMLL